jgi:NTP pyrophosphatase (non-canonical NTP hydrolase)
MLTEVGEFADAIKKHVYYGKALDVVNAGEELGDVMWYWALACRSLGLDPEKILDANIAKLHARYPEKFTDELADKRDLQAERDILDQGIK